MLVVAVICLCCGLAFIGHTIAQGVHTRAHDYQDRYLEAAEEQLTSLFVYVSAGDLLRYSYAAAGLGFILGFAAFFNLGPIAMMLGGGGLALVGFWVPRLTIRVLVERRKSDFLSQFADAIGIMSNGFKAGLSLQQTVELVAKEMPAPVGEEFNIICRDRRLGRSLDEAMVRLGQRMPVADVRMFVMVVRLSQRMGGGVTEALSRVAETIRNRTMIERRVKSITVEVRLQSIIMALIPFIMGVLLFLIAPELMTPLFETSLGYIILVAVAILELVGGLVMWKLTKIKY